MTDKREQVPFLKLKGKMDHMTDDDGIGYILLRLLHASEGKPQRTMDEWILEVL